VATQTCRRLQNRDGTSAMVLDAMCQSEFFQKLAAVVAGDVRKIETECLCPKWLIMFVAQTSRFFQAIRGYPLLLGVEHRRQFDPKY